MKLGNLLIAGTAAAISYWVVSNKDKIAEEIQETSHLLEDISTSYAKIQEQAQIISSYSQPLKEMTQDLNYKFRVYQQEAAGHLQEIQAIQEKYQSTTPKNNPS